MLILSSRSFARGRVSTCSLVASLLLGIAVGPAAAQLTPAAATRIAQLDKLAMENYDGLEFDAAKKQLLEALKLAETAKVTDKPLLGRTNVNLGIVYGAGFNDRITAIKYFTAALKHDRKATLPAARATPALEEMFKSAKDNLGPEVPEPSAFHHKVVDEATEGQSVVVRVVTRPSLGATSVLLFVRQSGTARFRSIKMRAYNGGIYQAMIPVEEVKGKSIYYYVEAQDESGGRVAGSGEAASPNIISITPSRRRDPDEGRKKPKPKSGPTRFSIAVMGGTGLGLVFGGASESAHLRNKAAPEQVDIAPGGSIAPAHLAIDLAYHITQDWHISALVRLQMLTALRGENTSEKLSVLGLVRAKRYFGEGLLRFYLSFGAGGGQLRHRIPLGDYDSDPATADDIVDARVAGVAAFGFGGGIHVAFHRNVGLVFEVVGMILVPDFAAHADLNLGLAFSF